MIRFVNTTGDWIQRHVMEIMLLLASLCVSSVAYIHHETTRVYDIAIRHIQLEEPILQAVVESDAITKSAIAKRIYESSNATVTQADLKEVVDGLAVMKIKVDQLDARIEALGLLQDQRTQLNKQLQLQQAKKKKEKEKEKEK